jgi:predicted enzyme related to lactoylglutathione lyase
LARVVHFEVAVEDVKRAAAFFENVFGWKLDRQEGPWGTFLALITGDEKEPGISGAVYERTFPSDGVINTLDVDDVDKYIDRIKKAGGEITFEKCPIPAVGYLAYFKDKDGNQFGMMQRDETVEVGK